MCESLGVNGFKWRKDIEKFTNKFIKIYDHNSSKGYLLEADFKYPKILRIKHKKLPFLPGKDFPNEKSKVKDLFANVKDKI